MDARTLTALKGSIEKWEKIVEGTGENRGANNCPLCQLFLLTPEGDIREENLCSGCPVMAMSREPGCARTPYRTYEDARDFDNKIQMKKAAQAELDFLRSLLPGE